MGKLGDLSNTWHRDEELLMILIKDKSLKKQVGQSVYIMLKLKRLLPLFEFEDSICLLNIRELISEIISTDVLTGSSVGLAVLVIHRIAIRTPS